MVTRNAHRGFKSVMCGLFIGLPALASAQLPDPPPYVVMEWTPGSSINDINNLGQFVGTLSSGGNGYLSDRAPDPNVIVLGKCTPVAISDAGLIAGSWRAPQASLDSGFVIVPEDTDADGKPDRWYRDDNSDGVNDLIRDLGPVTFCYDIFGWGANDVNGDGVVIGNVYCVVLPSTLTSHAVVITPEDTNSDGEPDSWFRDDDLDGENDLMVDLGPLAGTQDSAIATDLNASGDIAGYSWDNSDDWYADLRGVLWEEAGSAQDLGILYPPAPNRDWASIALGINDLSQVVGWSDTPYAAYPSHLIHTTLWSSQTGLVDLGVMATDPNCEPLESEARDINNSGWIVGINVTHTACGSQDSSPSAFLLIPMDTDSDGNPDTWFYNSNEDSPLDGPNELMISLNALQNVAILTSVSEITDAGQIRAYSASSERSYILTPCPTLDCPDLNGDGQVNIADLGILLGAYGTSAAGDVDCDGDTDITDLGILNAHFGQTCN